MMLELKKLNTTFLERLQNRHLVISTLWLFAYTSIPTIFFGALFVTLILNFSPDVYATIGKGAGQRNLHWLPTIVFNPLIESALLAAIVRCSLRLQAGWYSVLIAALCLALLHTIQNLTWGLTVLCFFLIQSYAFFRIYPDGLMRSFGVLALAHALHNAVIVLVLFFSTA